MLSEGHNSEVYDNFTYLNESTSTYEFNPDFDSSNTCKATQNSEIPIDGESSERFNLNYMHSKHYLTGICDYSDDLVNIDKIKHENLFSDVKLCAINKIYDKAASKLKEDLTIHYKSVQEEIMSSVKSLFSVEMQRIKTDMIKLHEQVNSLRDLARNHEGTIARKEQIICNLTDNIKKLKTQMEMNMKEQNAKRKSFCIKLADRYYKQNILKQAIVAWKQFMECSWKQRNFHRLTLEAQSECIKIKNELNQKILQLEAELKVSQSELESVKAKQAGEQAALKTALMRGVCALNMETMAVFNETLPHSNKEYDNKKLITVDSQLLREPYSTENHLHLVQLTPMKTNGCHPDRTIHNQSEKMIFNMQTTHQSSEYTNILALMLQHTNGYHTAFSDQNRPNSMEAWPRDTLHNLEPSVNNVIRKGNYIKPLSHSTEICERWLGDHSDYTVKDPLNLSGLPAYKTYSRQVDEKISNSDDSEVQHDDQMEYQWLPNKNLTLNRNCDTSFELNTNSTNCKYKRIDPNLYNVKSSISVENAKKMLNSRNASNRVYSIGKQNKLLSYSRPQTVQHGIPTGNCLNGSTAMGNILVQRHHPSNQIISTENVNMHKHTISTEVHYPPCQHNLSSTSRLYSDSYSYR
ncbi:hypothetical protein MN116_004634 [Schistosoma mekongi]|uniref:Centrosomal protein POC5 n=1 Tax=Schistosoma mekongi TaxID=38744 RepID=A0AAE1ZCB6_SCHME|nr:hypothetical protein MN116_004634 [Schistosoma mekongi]